VRGCADLYGYLLPPTFLKNKIFPKNPHARCVIALLLYKIATSCQPTEMHKKTPAHSSIPSNSVAPHPDSRYGVEVLNLNNPKSVWNLIDDKFQAALRDVPDYFHKMDEKQLAKLHKPHPVINMVRMQFWAEYDRAHAEGLPKMDMTRVWAGACTREYWALVILKNTKWVGWISIPPLNYARKIEEALDKSYDRMREILECDPIDPASGKLMVPVARLQMQIHKMLEDRKLGAVTQNLNHQHQAIVFHGDAEKHLMEYGAMRDMDSLTEKEKRIEARLLEMGVPKEQIVAETLERLEDPDIRERRGFAPLGKKDSSR
jgi:hypothetical protein